MSTESLKDSLFNDKRSFALFFYKNDSAKNRAIVLTTFKLKVWYCRLIKVRKEVFESASRGAGAIREKDPLSISKQEALLLSEFSAVSRWIDRGKGARHAYYTGKGLPRSNAVCIASEWGAPG